MLTIDIVSDVICPWCFIGKRRLDQALASLPRPIEAKIAFHPFQLDPSIPPEGADLRERLRKKYGADPEAMFGRVEEAARSSGIALDFARVRRTPPTLPAHALLRRALEKGTQPALAEALFAAYFLEGQDLAKPEVLAGIAAKHGFAEAEAARIVKDEAELGETAAEARAVASKGITGVPFFVFGGTVGVSGAQSAEVLRGAIAKAQA